MTYSVYDSVSGQILFAVHNDHETIPDNAIDGHYNNQDHYVDTITKTVIDKSAQPSIDHEWDWSTKTWQLNNSKATVSARQQRNTLLLSVDRVNPVWYSALTNEQQAELISYRSALLAVPEQSGFPTAIEWPSKPSWLG